MEEKLEKTTVKTIEALARIGRFLDKYGDKLNKRQVARISKAIQELKSKSNVL